MIPFLVSTADTDEDFKFTKCHRLKKIMLITNRSQNTNSLQTEKSHHYDNSLLSFIV